MSDSRRDRIAAVLEQHKTDPYGDWDCECGTTGIKWRDHAADAVIAALGLRGCTDPWHWETGEPFRCPSCGYWMGEGYVEP